LRNRFRSNRPSNSAGDATATRGLTVTLRVDRRAGSALFSVSTSPRQVRLTAPVKRLLAALCLVTCLSSCGPATPTSSAPPSPPSIPATSLVQNGDFSQGIARWDGDARLAAAPGPGITVRLNLAAWTRVYQTFRSAAGAQFAVRVNYKLTPGMYTSDDPANYSDITRKSSSTASSATTPRPSSPTSSTARSVIPATL
jgi:hypothetical protein